MWCAEDEAALENAEKNDETPTEVPAGEASAAEPPAPEENVTEAPPPEDKVIEAPPPENIVPPSPVPPAAEDVAPTEDASAAVEDTAPPAEQVSPLPEPVAVSSQQIELTEVTAPAEDAEPPADTASAEHVTEQASGPVEVVALETDADVQTDADAAAEADETGLKPAPRIESGCRLDRDVLLASLQEVQNYLHQAGAQEQTDESYIERLSDLVRVLNADMNNLRDYCERSQNQLESIRDPIKDITDKIFKTIAVAETEEEGGEQRKYKFVWLHLCAM